MTVTVQEAATWATRQTPSSYLLLTVPDETRDSAFQVSGEESGSEDHLSPSANFPKTGEEGGRGIVVVCFS